MKNMKKILVYTAALLLTSLFSLRAQQSYLDEISAENTSITKKAGITIVNFDYNLDKLTLDKNHMLVITPIVTSADGSKKIELEPVIVLGRTRNNIINRPYTWKGKTAPNPDAFANLVRKNGTSQKIHYSNTLPYESWQRQAHLLLKSEIAGCADCALQGSVKNILDKILPDAFIPDYRMAYIIPEVEPVKQRSERYSAHLNYIVGRYDLLPNFENNASELAKVDKIINELKADKDLRITDFVISGYASPEDSKARNLMLSQRRAETFAKYTEKKYGYNRNQFKVEWFGEDWKGLRDAVTTSQLPNKDAIVQIIDNVPDFDARDARLIALDNGQTYSRLLREFYPPLRRNDYDISFISRPFNVDEAKEVIKTKPKLLSLNEMFLVANTYPNDSPEYKKVFDIAADTFPKSEVANLNAAVGELQKNNPDAAIKRLQTIQNSDKAMNLMGIAYALKKDENRAKDFFNKAIQKGNADATYNLSQYQQYIDDNM